MCSWCGCQDEDQDEQDEDQDEQDDGLDSYRERAEEQEANDRTDWDNDDSPSEK